MPKSLAVFVGHRPFKDVTVDQFLRGFNATPRQRPICQPIGSQALLHHWLLFGLIASYLFCSRSDGSESLTESELADLTDVTLAIEDTDEDDEDDEDNEDDEEDLTDVTLVSDDAY